MKENLISMNTQVATHLYYLNEFNSVLERDLREFFSQQKSDNCWPEMFTLVRDATISFCDSRFLIDQPSFIFALLQRHPHLMTTYLEPSELTIDPDGETSLYDFLCDTFLNEQTEKAMGIGVELEVFAEENGVINLTPKFTASNLEVH